MNPTDINSWKSSEGYLAVALKLKRLHAFPTFFFLKKVQVMQIISYIKIQ